MTATRTGYTVRAYTPRDESAVLALMERCLQGGPTGHRTAEFFRWKHEANPFGRSFSLVAQEGGEIIGFRTFLRWRFLAGDEPVEAVRAVDTATHPDHQGRGIFTTLTLAALEGLGDEVALVFNTPNERSRPGYLKMGWSPVGTVPITVRPVHPLGLVRGGVSARRGRGAPSGPPPPSPLPAAREALQDEAAVADLLARARPDGSRLVTDRSVAYLRWRYGDAPGLGYRAVTIGSGGRLAGMALGRPRRRGSLREFLIAEVITADDDARTARQLLRRAARSGCDHVVAHFPRGTRLPAAGLVTGYLPVPRLGLNLVAKPLTPDLERALTLRAWQLSLGDLEVF